MHHQGDRLAGRPGLAVAGLEGNVVDAQGTVGLRPGGGEPHEEQTQQEREPDPDHWSTSWPHLAVSAPHTTARPGRFPAATGSVGAVRIRQANDQTSAEGMAGRLRAEGIPAEIIQADAGAPYGGVGGASAPNGRAAGGGRGGNSGGAG